MSAELAERGARRLRYPTELRERVVRIVRAHMFDPGRADAAARAPAARAVTATGSRFDLLDHKEADLRGQGRAPAAATSSSGSRGFRRRGRAASRRARTGCATSRSTATT